jgi:hypothetical protein
VENGGDRAGVADDARERVVLQWSRRFTAMQAARASGVPAG